MTRSPSEPGARGRPSGPAPAGAAVHVVDDDDAIRDALSWLLRSRGVPARTWPSAEAFPADVREQLFQPFFSTKAEGMGMGLNICRSIIEFHRGRVWAEPNPEGGSVFSFSLPVERA